MVDSPYYRPPNGEGLPSDGGPAPLTPEPDGRRPVDWVVVATATSPTIATEVLERFDNQEILARSLPPLDEGGEIAIEVPAAQEAAAVAFLDDHAADLLEYRGFAPELPRSGDGPRSGATTAGWIIGVLLVVCVVLLLAS